MKLEEMKLDDLLYMNLYMLSKKLFESIDYKIVNKSEFYKGEKVKVGYKQQHGPTYWLEEVPFYEIQYNEISRDKYYKLKKTNAILKVTITKKIRTYKDEYNYILNSKIKDKENALINLYNDFYNLADEYITELEKYKSFLNENLFSSAS